MSALENKIITTSWDVRAPTSQNKGNFFSHGCFYSLLIKRMVSYFVPQGQGGTRLSVPQGRGHFCCHLHSCFLCTCSLHPVVCLWSAPGRPLLLHGGQPCPALAFCERLRSVFYVFTKPPTAAACRAVTNTWYGANPQLKLKSSLVWWKAC